MGKNEEFKPVSTQAMLKSTLAIFAIFGTFVYISNRLTEPKRERDFAIKQAQFNKQATLVGKENIRERNTTALYFDLDGDKKTDSVMLIQHTDLSTEKRLAIVNDMKVGETKKVVDWATPFAQKGVPVISKYRSDHRISYKELEKE